MILQWTSYSTVKMRFPKDIKNDSIQDVWPGLLLLWYNMICCMLAHCGGKISAWQAKSAKGESWSFWTKAKSLNSSSTSQRAHSLFLSRTRSPRSLSPGEKLICQLVYLRSTVFGNVVQQPFTLQSSTTFWTLHKPRKLTLNRGSSERTSNIPWKW